MKKIAFLLLVGSIIFSGALLMPAHATENANVPPPGLRLVQEEPASLIFEINTPEYEITDTAGHHLQVSDYQTLSQAGSPELPFVSTLISVPPQAEVQVHILAQDGTTLPGSFTIPPAPTPGQMLDDFTMGAAQVIPNEEIYANDTLFPNSPVQLGEDAWMRDQRLVALRVFPFQYNPVRGNLVWYKTLRVEVTFSNTNRSAPASSPLSDVFSSMVINSMEGTSSSTGSSIEPNAPLYAPTLTEAAYKITVDEDGIYRVTYAELQAAGMDVDNVDPAQFKLTSQGQEIAIYVEGEGDSSFDSDDYITFYGQKFSGDRLASLYADSMDDWTSICYRCEIKDLIGKYTDENVYWLHLDASGGARMGASDGTPDGSTVPDYYMATAHAEESVEWYTWHLTSADTWFWERVRNTDTHSYSTTLNAIADTAPVNATVSGEVVSRLNADHDTHFYLNAESTLIDETAWSGITDHDFSAQIALSALLEGENQLLFKHDREPSDDIYFNWFEIEYPRQFQAQDDQILFSRNEEGASWQYEIGNFASPSVEAFEITNPTAPVRITGSTLDTGTLTFSATHSTEAEYFVVGSDAILSPKAISFYTPPNFAALSEADYIFITHSDFSAALGTLATHRQNQGLSTLIIDIDDLYNSFNYGIYHTIAIKNFLAYTFDNWSTPPSYVLLVGNGHFNLKNYTGTTRWDTTDPNFMPPNLAFVDPWQGEVDSSNLLATLVGDDALPDLVIGRLPISSVAELNTFIGKVTAYEQSGPQDWHSNVIQVSDNVPDPEGAGDFVAYSDGLVDDYVDPSHYQATKIYVNDYCGTSTNLCPAATTALINELNNSGALLMTYAGHATVDYWAHNVLTTNDVPRLTNITKLPVGLSLDCHDGYWIYPERPSLVGDLLRASNGGYIGAFAPTGEGNSSGHNSLAKGFYQALITDNTTDFGAVTLASKLFLYGTGNNYDLLHTFTLFGDPALQIQTSPNRTMADFNGDGDTDVSVYRPSNGRWFSMDEGQIQWGRTGDLPVPGNYDGDGDTDIAIFRPSNGKWYVYGETPIKWGAAGDVPMPCDYNGDGIDEFAVYRPTNGNWYIQGQSFIPWGIPNDIPAPADYDGDGTCDVAIYRPSNGKWYIYGQAPVKWGALDDIPVPGDYDGDGDDDIAVYRPSNGNWYIMGQSFVSWGLPGDIPVPGDYNENGEIDIAILRPSNGKWYILGLSPLKWYVAGDYPLPVRDTNADGDAHH